ncbi:hypothetical protein QAD02_003151 [Eretmocerus hayati]|uniref:Uncharacterized protein n=1 Tax=Eretmocerus hayati TaxID=131215 RepID=A0ACC2NNT3_9HYME|nr:hypothetical protein QAD02_003151 [Eretmocerus hayati]
MSSQTVATHPPPPPEATPVCPSTTPLVSVNLVPGDVPAASPLPSLITVPSPIDSVFSALSDYNAHPSPPINFPDVVNYASPPCPVITPLHMTSTPSGRTCSPTLASLNSDDLPRTPPKSLIKCIEVVNLVLPLGFSSTRPASSASVDSGQVSITPCFSPLGSDPVPPSECGDPALLDWINVPPSTSPEIPVGPHTPYILSCFANPSTSDGITVPNPTTSIILPPTSYLDTCEPISSAESTPKVSPQAPIFPEPLPITLIDYGFEPLDLTIPPVLRVVDNPGNASSTDSDAPHLMPL